MSQQHYNLDVIKLVELSKQDVHLITIEATVVTGFENLALEECQEKCKPVNKCRAKGRIYFNILVESFPDVMKLRSVDNVFLVNECLGKIELKKNKEEDLDLVRSLVDRVDWKGTLSTWAKLTEFEGILFPLMEESTDKVAEDITKIVLDEKNDNLLENNLDNINIINNIENTDSENKDIVSNKDDLLSEKVQNSLELPKRRNSASSDDSFYSVEEAEFTTEDAAAPVKSCVLEEKSLNTNNTDSKKNINDVQDGSGNKKVIAKKDVDPNILKFRATCNRTGDHSFSSMEAAAVFGGTLQDKFNWTVNLDKFNLNVILNINSDKCYICSAITSRSLHRRNITHFGYTTLRSTMCYNMVRLAEPTKGEIIIDPLCGGGSIPIEGALGFPNTYHICGDNNDKAMNRTVANINYITKKQSLLVDPLKWSAKRIPLKDQCIDVFVTDLPFGKRSGKRSDNLNLYKKVLTEMARVIRCGTGRAVVLTNDKTSLTRALGGNNGIYWRQINSFGVNQGGLFSTVFLLLRTSKQYLL